MNGVERSNLKKKQKPNEGVRYFAQGAQTLLIHVRKGPWLLRASKP